MTTKIVCRLLDAEDRLLGWVEHAAAVRGDGCLRASGPVQISVTTAGQPVCVSLHWADLNVETRIGSFVPSVLAGQVLQVFAPDMPMIKVGEMPGPLPPVTVGSVTVPIPEGRLGTKGYA